MITKYVVLDPRTSLLLNFLPVWCGAVIPSLRGHGAPMAGLIDVALGNLPSSVAFIPTPQATWMPLLFPVSASRFRHTYPPLQLPLPAGPLPQRFTSQPQLTLGAIRVWPVPLLWCPFPSVHPPGAHRTLCISESFLENCPPSASLASKLLEDVEYLLLNESTGYLSAGQMVAAVVFFCFSLSPHSFKEFLIPNDLKMTWSRSCKIVVWGVGALTPCLLVLNKLLDQWSADEWLFKNIWNLLYSLRGTMKY